LPFVFFAPERVFWGWSRNLIFREVEDRDLIAKARRGNVDAYNVLVSRWEKRVVQLSAAPGGTFGKTLSI